MVGDHTGILGAEVFYHKCNLSVCRLSGLGHGGTAHRRGHAATASTWTLTDRLVLFVGVGRLSVGDRVGRPARRRDGHERQTTRT